MSDIGQNNPKFQTLVFSLIFIILIGHLLVMGQSVLLPIIIAVISVYILVSASEWMKRQPVLKHMPEWMRRLLVLLAFVFCIMTLVGVIISTSEQVIAQLPVYQQNITTMLDGILTSFGREKMPDWAKVWQDATNRIDVQGILTGLLGSLSSLAGTVFMVVVYAMFLMGERGGFAHKIATALPGESAAQTQRIVQEINASIGDYLAVKTLINVILAAVSFAILWLYGVDFALFWAIMIGLLNYIPYVGSLLGVALPVLLTMAQFGSLQSTALVAILLLAVQTWVGNVLEPRMIGRTVNMSPFVVLVALTVWSSLWGLAGAILAIPLTAVIAIIMAAFEATRPLAILLAEDVDQFIKSG